MDKIDKPNSLAQDFDQWAERLLENAGFMDCLYEKIRAREEARRDQFAHALGQAALEGARIVREKLYGPDVDA